MNANNYYDYLVRARRDLWAFLETIPDAELSKSVLSGSRFHCIKDLLLHIAVVEDSWIHEDILRDQPVWETALPIENPQDGPHYASTLLETILEYWRAVERSTLAYLETLDQPELERLVTVGTRLFTVEGLIWHVMQHETRHTAQVSILARQLGFMPPQLDLIGFLPVKANP